MKVGVLLPRSTDHPAMGFDLLDGLRLRLRHEGLEDAKTISEKYRFRRRQKRCIRQSRKIADGRRADCVVAYLSPVNAELLYPLFETAGKALIVLDPGMNYPTDTKSSRAVCISVSGHTGIVLLRQKCGRERCQRGIGHLVLRWRLPRPLGLLPRCRGSRR